MDKKKAFASFLSNVQVYYKRFQLKDCFFLFAHLKETGVDKKHIRNAKEP